MNDQKTIENIDKNVNELITLEKSYGHSCFTYGLTNTNEYKEKYDLLVSLLLKIENTDPAHGIDEDGIFLLEMLSSHICSPEAIAYILINNIPDSKMALKIIETHLKSMSMTDYSFFAGYFYKNKMESIENKAAPLIQNMRFSIKCTDTINSTFIKRFRTDKSVSDRRFS